ncbi:ABC-2 type transport system ATP-binding protein [Plantibacter flavus]|uniref:ABC-2 type transport system ATP-binding protein n=1 Tax=Plantibacter flavus TaxID=150123 RepID=A0A3N2BYI9_9MICO|nr:ATP-binding cassette domain-containing protein [Plantibacter flavus]ROR80330.1 ABC-2 type transport system ATP-binding protein [Plantibacter flavus]SMG35277.1 ABC-2 type transport system ATP-binding protein [Plantibacter flavus]
MIEARHLTKRHGASVAVDDVSFTVAPGTVTGFLGPNGAGKSTIMRMIVGLARPTSGTVTIDGRRYAGSPAPLQQVGALLDAGAVHPGRTARNHLRTIARTHGIPDRRVDEVISLTGLESVARRRAGAFSLGMGQRLGIATALLGDPDTLVLDEPVNGLDPEGVIWVRQLCRHLASEGRAVLLSSHLMSEMAQTADHLIVLGRGRVIADASVADVLARAGGGTVAVRTDAVDRLADFVRPMGATVTYLAADRIEISGLDADEIALAASRIGVTLFELTPQRASLEAAFLGLTEDSVEYRSGSAGRA